MKEKEPVPIPDWERIEYIFRSEGFRTINHFARFLGLKRAENLYQIKRGNNGISKELARMICDKFPQYQYTWILSGEAIPMNSRPMASLLGIYPCDAFHYKNMEGILFHQLDYFTLIPPGVLESSPTAPAPAILREINPENIIYEEFYCILSAGKCFYRWVYPSPNIDEILVRRPDRQDKLPMKRMMVEQLFLVRGVLVDPTLLQ